MLVMPCLAAADEAESVWSTNLGLTYLATSGNTDTRSFGFDLKVERKPAPWGVEIVAAANQTDENGTATAERYLAGARAKRALAGRWDLFGGISGEQNEFAGFDLLVLAETGVIYKALLGPVHSLAFDLGFTWTDENRIEPEVDVDYLGAVAGLNYEWKISEVAVFSQRLIYYPNFDESSDWRISSDTGLSASLTDTMALRIGYEVRYRNQPIGNNEGTDTTTKVSLVVKF